MTELEKDDAKKVNDVDIEISTHEKETNAMDEVVNKENSDEFKADIKGADLEKRISPESNKVILFVYQSS